jgi:hypothetical protein
MNGLRAAILTYGSICMTAARFDNSEEEWAQSLG